MILEKLSIIFTLMDWVFTYFALGMLVYFLANIRNTRNVDTYEENPKMSWKFIFFWPIMIFMKNK